MQYAHMHCLYVRNTIRYLCGLRLRPGYCRRSILFCRGNERATCVGQQNARTHLGKNVRTVFPSASFGDGDEECGHPSYRLHGSSSSRLPLLWLSLWFPFSFCRSQHHAKRKIQRGRMCHPTSHQHTSTHNDDNGS